MLRQPRIEALLRVVAVRGIGAGQDLLGQRIELRPGLRLVARLLAPMRQHPFQALQFGFQLRASVRQPGRGQLAAT